MKQLLLTCLTAYCCFTSLHAQSFDFAPIGAKWYYTELDDVPPAIIPHVMECTAKEMFHGKLCSKIIVPSIGPLESPVHLYTQNDTVFFYSTVTDQFEMLYDFRAKEGDTWVVGGVLSYDNVGNPLYADTIRVDSVRSISVNGENLKVWYITDGYYYDWGGRIFEKAGNDMLFAPKFGLWELTIWGLRCFETPDQLYHFDSFPCDTSYSLISNAYNPEDAYKIAITPNPFYDKITISSDASFNGGIIRLYDQLGKLMLEKPLTAGVTTFETQALPAGIYFWKISDVEKRIKTGRIVKI